MILHCPSPSGMVSKKRLIVSRETTLRCANEPKHTERVLRASSSKAGVKGILSQATPSYISYIGAPLGSSSACTGPVG